MGDVKESIRAALASDRPIARAQVRDWITQAEDVETDALLYELTDAAWSRIEPGLEPDETCALIQRYLFRCIRDNPHGDMSLSRYEAASRLEAWVDHLAGLEDARAQLNAIVAGVTDLS